MKYSYNGFVRIRQLKYALYLHHIVVMYISYSSWNTILEFCTISHKHRFYISLYCADFPSENENHC